MEKFTRSINITLEDLQEEMKRCLDILDLESIPITIKKGVYRTVGSYWYPTNDYPGGRIEISQVIQTSTKEEAFNVLRHEIAHYAGFMANGRKGTGHCAKEFRDACRKLGCSPSAKDKYVNIKYKYECYCKKCGKFIAGVEKRVGWVHRPGDFNSNCCDASIRVIERVWANETK